MTEKLPADWLSIHVFLADPAQQDRYLRERVGVLVHQWQAAGELDQWFFIRYWEGGPHLRIRLRGVLSSRPEVAIEALSRNLAAYLSAIPPQRDEYYHGHLFDGQPLDPRTLPWYPEGSIAQIAYEPEILRYGGAAQMPASEKLFMLSSRLALELCNATADKPAARLSAALTLMAVAVMAAGQTMSGVGAYFSRYATQWAPHSDRIRPLATRLSAPDGEVSPAQVAMLKRVWAELATGANPRSANGAWARGVAELIALLRAQHDAAALKSPVYGQLASDREAFQMLQLNILGSHIHMLNNRLGIAPTVEHLLATALVRASAAAGEADTLEQAQA